TPFMSCSAKLPVYLVLAGTFFAARAGTVIFAIYVAGVVLSVATGRLFRSTLLKGMDAPFVMELPPYRVPMLKSLMIHMWDRSKMFLRKMGGIILVGSVIIWALSAFPRNVVITGQYQVEMARLSAAFDIELKQAAGAEHEQLQVEKDQALRQLKSKRDAEQIGSSYMGRIGRFLAPVFSPLGIDWRGGVALLSGFVAKEIVVSTLGVLYAVDAQAEGDALSRALKASGMSSLAALSMMVFVLLYLPCLATVSAIRRETGSSGWMFFGIAYNTTIAWVAAFAVYQGGRLLGY
ncbi:MAG: ferrous iron transporter B, partial [Desulfobacterales bacterium]|nr:ferrous iron transporter B [Desulfobacterales bacterium]